MVQWLRTRLPLQGTRARSLVWKIPHAEEQLSLHPATTEPALWSPRAATPEPVCLEAVSTATEASGCEAPAPPPESWPQLPQLEKAPAQQQGPSAAKRIDRGRAWKSLVVSLTLEHGWSIYPSSPTLGPTPGRTANTCPHWSLHTSDLRGFMSEGQSRNNPNAHHVMNG